MPIATEKVHDQEWMQKHESNYDDRWRCGDCGGRLLYCWGWAFGYKEYILRCANDINHSKIENVFELSPSKIPGMTLNSVYKRSIENMENKLGQEKSKALAVYYGKASLTEVEATTILNTVWPTARGAELYKAVNICVQYGLNPLMKHLYMIPFKDAKSGKEELVCVLSIDAHRLIARRNHRFSYVDVTPRRMTPDEERKIYGVIDETKIRAITLIRDVKTGEEASGYGEIEKGKAVYGTDKGNSVYNLAFIRSERNALKKLYPADMPGEDIPVEDSNYIEGVAREVNANEAEPDQPSNEAQPAEQPLSDAPQSEPEVVDEKPAKQKAEPAPDRKVNAKELEALDELKMKQDISNSQLGDIMANKLGWRPCPRSLGDLTKTQYDELVEYIKKEL